MDHPWIAELYRALSERKLPGERAHARLSAYSRPAAEQFRTQDPSFKESGVLILLYPDQAGRLHTILIQRPSYRGVHASQVAFPGGKKEGADEDVRRTALREAHEEVGVHPSKVELLGALSEVPIPPSGYIVSPFVGYCEERPSLQREESEVDRILEVPLEHFLRADAIASQKVKAGSKGVLLTVPAYEREGRTIWGATAMMISELCMLLEEA